MLAVYLVINRHLSNTEDATRRKQEKQRGKNANNDDTTSKPFRMRLGGVDTLFIAMLLQRCDVRTTTIPF